MSTAFEGNENKDLVTTAKAPESDIVTTGTRLWARAEATLRLPWRPTVLGSPTWQHPRGGATRAERALKRLGAAGSACVPPTAASALAVLRPQPVSTVTASGRASRCSVGPCPGAVSLGDVFVQKDPLPAPQLQPPR